MKKVSLLTTTFTTADGTKLSCPNVTLSTAFIYNLRRSGDQSDSIQIEVDFLTPESKIKDLRNRMQTFVIEQNRDYHNNCDVNVVSLDSLNSIKLSFNFKHKGNWQDMGRRMRRKNDFMFALIRNIIDLEIKYSHAPDKTLEYRDQAWTLFKNSAS